MLRTSTVFLILGLVFAMGRPSVLAGFTGGPKAGADHEEGDLSPNSNWPAGLHAAVNQKNRVHGFWVNTTDVFFYRGGNREINSMIESLAAIKGVKARIILHAGAGKARSPWGTDRGAANWSVTCYCKVGKGGIAFGKPDSIDMDVWISDKIGLGELKIPEKIAIENGGEIESFIKKMRSKSGERKSQGNGGVKGGVSKPTEGP